jgi:YegS/Rv2252/BmrU family lipid kinase
MSKTLIILNPHAGSGRAGRVWKKLEPLLWKLLGELVIAVTEHPEDVAQHLDKAYASGLTRVISIGGDGTNHALVNALAKLNEQHPDGPPMVYGNLPIGSGRDWARSRGVPFDIEAAAHWIARAQPSPTDIGLVTYNGQREHFLNIASAGLSGEVDRRVNRTPTRRAWTFLQATVETIISHHPQPIQVVVDGDEWYEGSSYLVAVANGSTFGHGMKIAPTADTNDGLFDVVLVKGASRATILAALWRVYNGSHLTHPAVIFRQGREVKINSLAGALGLDLDGEHARGQHMTFTIRPGLLHILS